MAQRLGSLRLGSLHNAGSAFDFDVISDVPPPPVRRPDPEPPSSADTHPPERGRDAKSDEVGSR